VRSQHLSRPASLSFLTAGITLVIGLTTALPVPVLLWPVLAAGLLIMLNYLGGTNFRLRRRSVWLAALILAAMVYPLRYAEWKSEVKGLYAGFRDHRRLEGRLPMFPERMWEAQPQRFLLYAPASQHLKVEWEGASWSTEALGSGVFRWDYNPHQQGLPPISGGRAQVLLSSDGDGQREAALPFVAAVPHLGLLSSDPSSGWAAAPSETTDEVVVADRRGTVQRFAVGDGPSSCALWDQGRKILVGHRYQPAVWTLERATGRRLAEKALPGGVESLAVSPDETMVAVLYEGKTPGLSLLRLPGLEVLAQVDLRDPGEFLCFGRSAQELVIASRRHRCLSRWVLSGEDWAERDRWPLARPATSLCRGPEGKRVYLAATADNRDGSEQKGDHFVQDVILGLDLDSGRWVFRRPTQERRERQQFAGAIDSGCGPIDLKLDSQGSILVAYSGSHEIGRLPLTEGLEERLDFREQDLLCPSSVADLGQGVRLLSYPAQARLSWVGKDGRISALHHLGPSDEELKSQDHPAWQRRQGEIGFYEATNAGISCQSCHPRGDSDYARHDLGDVRLWSTLSLQGVADTAPYLRAAPYPSLPDLHSVADTEFGGFQREVTWDRAEVAAAFIEGQPLPTNPRQLLPRESSQTEAERRGLQVYHKAECQRCHSFPATTNLAVVPNQVLFPGPEGPDYYEALDVPSLRALWRSAPYLHDGRAGSCEDILDQTNPLDQHGRTSGLSESERADLIEFLLSL
jgi:hypothetical protein